MVLMFSSIMSSNRVKVTSRSDTPSTIGMSLRRIRIASRRAGSIRTSTEPTGAPSRVIASSVASLA